MPEVTLKDSTKIYYKIFGPELNVANIHSLIFIHGGPGLLDGRSYYNFWNQFASPKLRIIFPDQRGSGRSSDPHDISTLNIQQHAQDMHELREVLNIKKPFLAGVSQGGYVAISYAEQFPDDVSGLIITNTEAKRDTRERVKAYRYSLEKFFGVDKTRALYLSKQIEKIDQNWDFKTYENLFNNYYSKKGEQFEILMHEKTWNKFMSEEFPSFDLRTDLKKITCSVLYLAGEFDCVHPPACAEKTMQLMTNADVEFHIINQSADPVYVDQWEKTKEVIANFLANFGAA